MKYGLRRLVDDRISSIPDARVPISIADKDWPVAISIESFTFRFLIVFKKAVAEGSLSMWVWLECSTFQGGILNRVISRIWVLAFYQDWRILVGRGAISSVG
ncbi:MAG: hypothetical protein WCJ40_04145 [Planctomycetota bacterium]